MSALYHSKSYKCMFLATDIHYKTNMIEIYKAYNIYHYLPLEYRIICDTVEHIYDACPKYSELGNFRIIAYLYVSYGSRR